MLTGTVQNITIISNKNTKMERTTRGGGEGEPPYITYMGMCRPTGSWF